MDKNIISLEDFITASGKYKERLKSEELTQDVKNNGEKLLNRVCQLLKELGINKAVVSSGFRPSSINGKIKGAAKKSLHMLGKAIDLADVDGKLYKAISSKPELLKKYGLWLEHKDDTPTWVHLDMSSLRTDREVRIFRA
jgi:uncharacterized protein YcbK (DUF882 family)